MRAGFWGLGLFATSSLLIRFTRVVTERILASASKPIHRTARNTLRQDLHSFFSIFGSFQPFALQLDVFVPSRPAPLLQLLIKLLVPMVASFFIIE